MATDFKIAGRTISLAARLDFQQGLEVLTGGTMHRMANGAGILIGGWRKHKFTLSGSGWAPAPLIGINYNVPIEVELPLPVSLIVADSLPVGWTALSEKTITDVAGETYRAVIVKLSVLTLGPRMTDDNTNTPSWEMVLEEI